MESVMLNRYSALLTVLFLILVVRCQSQDFTVPENYAFNSREDYLKYEKDVMSCIDWLENTYIDKDVEKRKAAEKFLLMWIVGAPTIKIEIDMNIANFWEKNIVLSFIYMGGWTKLQLQNPNLKTDLVKGNAAAIRSAIKVYTMNKDHGIVFDENIEKYIQMEKNGSLEKWLAENIKAKKE